MKLENIIIVCPDTNIKLWGTRFKDSYLSGGKTALLKLAHAWAQEGHNVTIAAGAVDLKMEAKSFSDAIPLRVVTFSQAVGTYSVAIYVTRYAGHFTFPGIELINAERRILWIVGPQKTEAPEDVVIDLYVVPSQFLAQRAVKEWLLDARQGHQDAITYIALSGMIIARFMLAILGRD
jgi:hypothetical protein